jgi:hypothetical protein
LAKSIKLQGDTANQQLHCIGIISSENILKLSWLLNRDLKFQLSQSESLTEKDKEFVLFQHETESLGKISLLGNKNETISYFPELKNIDYLLFFPFEIDAKSIIQKIKNIPEISSTLILDLNNLKSKNKISELF